MNCQDIAQILDNMDIRLARSVQVSAHLSACAECASHWTLQQQFQALPDISAPVGLAARMRRAVAQSVPARPTRRVANGYVWSAAALAAAAAAVLVVRWDRTDAVPSDAAVQVRPAVEPATSADYTAPTTAAMTAAAPAYRSGHAASPQQPGVTAGAFRVGVLPQSSRGNDAAAQSAIESFYEAIVAGLRKDPGLQLVTVASREAAVDQVDFLLDVSASSTEKGLRAMLRATRFGSSPVTLPIAGEFDASCAAPVAGVAARCLDAESLADSMLGTLRNVLLPMGPAQRQALVARVGDATVAPEQRIAALRELASPRVSAGGSPQRLESSSALQTPNLLEGAINLAATATAAHRAEIWRMLRGVHDPVLAEPLIQSARLDVDAAVRAEAVASLGAGFAGLPRVRTELAVVAEQDPKPLVRALAMRALSDEQSWRRYIVTALQDDTLPAPERLEPLFHHLNGGSEGLGELLDAASIRGFAAALAGVRGTPIEQRISTVVFSRAVEVQDPAMTDLLLERFRDESALNRTMILNQLIRRPRNARIEALLREVSSRDADQRLREIAAAALAGQSGEEAEGG